MEDQIKSLLCQQKDANQLIMRKNGGKAGGNEGKDCVRGAEETCSASTMPDTLFLV